jgi:hypothetical protein
MSAAPPCADPAAGVIVSTHPQRGHVRTADFDSDRQALQHAYDEMIRRPDLPRTLVLDAPDRPFALDGPLCVWQSSCRVTATGGPTLMPAPGYTGPLLETELRPETELGEDDLISNVVLDHLWLDGKGSAQGIKLRHLQLSTLHALHVRNTDGPGLWLSDFCIENLFSGLVLSDRCGNQELPALLIEPEGTLHPLGEKATDAVGNITVNSTRLAGIMIHFPANDALRVSAGPAPVTELRRHRKIQFSGCFFHGHGRQSRPLVTLEDAYEIAFVGTQMLLWQEEGVILQLGGAGARWPTGITMVSHCVFVGKPDSETVGIRAENVVTGAPCLAAFGNSFGSDDARLGHAVDWGDQPDKRAAWAGNAVHTKREPHRGRRPVDADAPPFA